MPVITVRIIRTQTLEGCNDIAIDAADAASAVEIVQQAFDDANERGSEVLQLPLGQEVILRDPREIIDGDSEVFAILEDGQAIIPPDDETDLQPVEVTLRRIFQALEAWAPVAHAIETLAAALDDERWGLVTSFCDPPGQGNAYDLATAGEDRQFIDKLDAALATAEPWLSWQPGPVIDDYETTDETAPA